VFDTNLVSAVGDSVEGYAGLGRNAPMRQWWCWLSWGPSTAFSFASLRSGGQGGEDGVRGRGRPRHILGVFWT